MMKRSLLALSVTLALGACTVGDPGNVDDIEGSHAVLYYDDPADPHGHVIAHFDRAASVFVSEDFAEQLGTRSVAFALPDGSTVHIASSQSSLETEEFTDVPLGSLLSAEAGNVVISPTADFDGLQQTRECRKIYVYINGGYAYSYCGTYFCYKQTCHPMNGFNNVGLWNGGGFLTIY